MYEDDGLEDRYCPELLDEEEDPSEYDDYHGIRD